MDVRRGRLFVETAGEGPAVVFLHPGLWDSRARDDQFEVFSRSYRCVRYDLRGYGRSSRPAPGVPYSHVEDLAAVMDAGGIERAALVGCSMGGRVSVDLALTDPERVTALVLAAPGLSRFQETEEETAQYAELEQEIEAAIEAGDLERSLRLDTSVWAALGVEDERGARIWQIALDNIHERTMDESAQRRPDPPAVQRL